MRMPVALVLLAALVPASLLVAGCGERGGEPTGPAVVTAHPSDQTVTEGETAVFTVAATGEAPVTYQWQRDGEDIPCATKPTFRVFSASPAVSGTQYGCVVSNALGSEASLSAVLTVQRALPDVLEHPRDLTVTAGESAEFRISARGSGTVGYQWQRGLVEITGETSWTYTLDPAELINDGDMFRCVVTNEAGKVTSAPATLTVTRPAILAPAVPGALTGVDYSFQIEGAGGTLPYTWTVTLGTLPAGLTLNSGGFLSGNSTALGSEAVTIQMQDNDAFTVTKDFTITVYEPAVQISLAPPFEPPVWDPLYLRVYGTTGEALTATLTATGGTGPYTWSVLLGSVSDGLALEPSTGVISGTPPRGGSQNALLEVTDSLGNSNRAAVCFSLNPLRPDMPRLLNVTYIVDAEGIPRMAITTWSASLMASLTVDAMFLNSRYPTRLRAFTPPTTPELVATLPPLGTGEEAWELPGLDGAVRLGKRILTDTDGRKTVMNSGRFESWGSDWPLYDSDSDSVPDSCDSVAGDDPSDALEIHRDVAVRTLGLEEDVTPPELVSVDAVYAGPPGIRNVRHFYVLRDESFIAGGEAYVEFPHASPIQTVTVPLAFQCIAQDDADFLKSFPGREHWAFPYIPRDYNLLGVRFWDCHGNVTELGLGLTEVHSAFTDVIIPDTDVDLDGIDDGWELRYFATVTDCDPGADPDGDTFQNFSEYYMRSDPTDETSVPISADSDSDGVPDVLDPDYAGSYVSLHQPLPPEALRNFDSDSDGMPDIWESCYALDPSSAADASGDPDADGLTNVNEFLRGDDPYDTDSDNDGTGDAADNEMGSSTSRSFRWGCVYTPQGQWAEYFYPGGDWGEVFDGSCHAASTVESYYPLAWVKVLVRLYPSGEVVVLDASKVSDPSFYGMWWITDEEVWATPPVGEYFELRGYFACDTHGRVTGY